MADLECVCVVMPPHKRMTEYCFTVRTVYSAVFLCVFCMACLDFLVYFPCAKAGRRPAELLLSEDLPHVWEPRLNPPAHREGDTLDSRFRLCGLVLNGFKTPVERPLFH